MKEALQGLQPDHMSILWSIIGGWLIWPVICGFLAAGRGQAYKGAIHGLTWGPLGLFFVLMQKKKFQCPTCGCKTLSRPVAESVEPLHAVPVGASDAGSVGPMPALRGGSLLSSSSEVAFKPSGRFVVPPVAPSQREVTAPAPAVSATPNRSVLEQACAGYSEEEAARLLDWVNSAKATIQTEPAKPAFLIPPVKPAVAPKPTVTHAAPAIPPVPARLPPIPSAASVST